MSAPHSFTRKLHTTGMFIYCGKCGLVRLGNKATMKAVARPCGGLRDLDDDQYLKATKGKR